MLKSSISLLMKLAYDDGRDYLQNFITDYFNLSDIGLKKCFNIEKSNETKERIKTFDIKVYHKSKKKKKRSQVAMKTLEDCNKIQYIFKRRKRHFYKEKMIFYILQQQKWLKKVFSSQSSQETKVVYQKTEDEII